MQKEQRLYHISDLNVVAAVRLKYHRTPVDGQLI